MAYGNWYDCTYSCVYKSFLWLKVTQTTINDQIFFESSSLLAETWSFHQWKNLKNQLVYFKKQILE